MCGVSQDFGPWLTRATGTPVDGFVEHIPQRCPVRRLAFADSVKLWRSLHLSDPPVLVLSYEQYAENGRDCRVGEDKDGRDDAGIVQGSGG